MFTTSSSPLIILNTSVAVNVNGGSPLNYVICSITNPQEVQIGQFFMSDNGISPDTVSGDGRYSVSVSISNIQCLLVGKYNIEYLAENNSGLFSNLITSDFRVVNSANQPPVIISSNLPDSVIRPLPGDSSLLTITVNAGDPDGLCDIRDVTFVTVRPNGVTLPPIPMFNNQNGQFTFSNYVSYSSDPSSYGYFKYTFTVKDNSGISGIPLTDSIKFIQPD
ncbi:MAG: hypothetical protein JNJ56_00410 [Ignavibacteria bacterium]|nr:hypothetical protein [Ignavibacteria bacterium]